jgi:hypothetical protein
VSINSEHPDVAVGGALDNKVIAVILHLYLTNTAICHLTDPYIMQSISCYGTEQPIEGSVTQDVAQIVSVRLLKKFHVAQKL